MNRSASSEQSVYPSRYTRTSLSTAVSHKFTLRVKGTDYPTFQVEPWPQSPGRLFTFTTAVHGPLPLLFLWSVNPGGERTRRRIIITLRIHDWSMVSVRRVINYFGPELDIWETGTVEIHINGIAGRKSHMTRKLPELVPTCNYFFTSTYF